MRLAIALSLPLALLGCLVGDPCRSSGSEGSSTVMKVSPGAFRSDPEVERNPCRLVASSMNVALPSVESCANLTLTVDDARREVRVSYDWEGKHYAEVYRVTGSHDVAR